jgi:predicted ribosomally synthesized peptide with SipW-like signal peptide
MKDYKRRVLATMLVLGAIGGAGVLGTLSAFSSTTESGDNRFRAGTVALGDNDAGTAMYNVSNQKPGVDTVRCIQVSYTGSLDSDVRLYTTSTINASASNVNLKVEKGTSSGSTGFPDCGTFSSQATLYDGSLKGFDSRSSYAGGIAAYPGAETKWVTGDTLVFRFTLSVNDSGGGADSGLHTFTWEARNN